MSGLAMGIDTVFSALALLAAKLARPRFVGSGMP
jgi:hypothetical protein